MGHEGPLRGEGTIPSAWDAPCRALRGHDAGSFASYSNRERCRRLEFGQLLSSCCNPARRCRAEQKCELDESALVFSCFLAEFWSLLSCFPGRSRVRRGAVLHGIYLAAAM